MRDTCRSQVSMPTEFTVDQGELLGKWRVVGIERRHGRLRVFVTDGQREAVLGVAPRSSRDDPGAFGAGAVRCWFEGNKVPAEHLAPAAQILVQRASDDAVGFGLWLDSDGAKSADQSHPAEDATRPLHHSRLPGPGTRLGTWHLVGTEVGDAFVRVLLRRSKQQVSFRLSPVQQAGTGPLGRDGAHITYAGDQLPEGATEALDAWCLAATDHDTRSLGGIVADLLTSPDSLGLGSADRTIRVRFDDPEADIAGATDLLTSLRPELTARLRLVNKNGKGPPNAVQTRDTLERARSLVPAGIDVAANHDTQGSRGPTKTSSSKNVIDINRHAQDDEKPEITAKSQVDLDIPSPRDPAVDWRSRLRTMLLNRPEKSITLAELLPPTLVPRWPCALPWIRFEVSPSGWVGPCCVDYQAVRSRLAREAQALDEWNSARLQEFRRAMTGRGHPRTCTQTCPFLNAGTQKPGLVRLHGGPEEHVANLVLVVEDLIAGATVMRGRPLEICVAATTFCNYDCQMCDYGETGTLDDELSTTFWTGLTEALRTAQFLEVNGGEPLGSPNFRAFLGTLDRESLPQLRVLLITNGSYLSAKQLKKYQRVPFENITVSINAATGPTYERVNRGLAWSRASEHLRAIKNASASGQLSGRVQFSMVLLRDNIDEIEAFAALARDHGATIRYQLPLRNRNNASIMTDMDLMKSAMWRLESVASSLLREGRLREARGAAGQAQVLWQRIVDGVTKPL